MGPTVHRRSVMYRNPKIQTVLREENTLIIMYQRALVKTVTTSPNPECVLCKKKVLKNVSMTPSKFKGHVEAKNSEHKISL